MMRWRECVARLAVVAGGLFLSVNGCGGETDTGAQEGDASSASTMSTMSTTSTTSTMSTNAGATVAGRPGASADAGSSARAGSGAAPSASSDSSTASQQAGAAAQSGQSASGASGTSGTSGAGGTSAVAGSGGSATSGAAAGSGASSAAAPAGEATFSAIFSEILTKGATGNCMFAACHGGEPDPAVNGGLQIKAGDKAGAYKNLVNAKSPGMVCSGKTYVVPGDSEGSLLYQKLLDAPPCGAKMPIGSPLTAAQIAQIAKWIDDGAMDN